MGWNWLEGLVRFSVELGKDGPELHLEVALDAEGVAIAVGERLASWPFAEPQRQDEAKSREREYGTKTDGSEQRQVEEERPKDGPRNGGVFPNGNHANDTGPASANLPNGERESEGRSGFWRNVPCPSVNPVVPGHA